MIDLLKKIKSACSLHCACVVVKILHSRLVAVCDEAHNVRPRGGKNRDCKTTGKGREGKERNLHRVNCC